MTDAIITVRLRMNDGGVVCRDTLISIEDLLWLTR